MYGHRFRGLVTAVSEWGGAWSAGRGQLSEVKGQRSSRAVVPLRAPSTDLLATGPGERVRLLGEPSVTGTRFRTYRAPPLPSSSTATRVGVSCSKKLTGLLTGRCHGEL